MSTDMRLLILTHLRAALERRDKAAVLRALETAHRYGDIPLANDLYTAIQKSSWAAVEGIYLHLGGVGAGDPAKGAGGIEKARETACGGQGA